MDGGRAAEPGATGWVDLARNPPGIGVTYEAIRRRQAEGAGADRSWRVGAEGEFEVADLLATLTEPSRWDRLRGRAPGWFVLHSVPLGDGRGRVRGDVEALRAFSAVLGAEDVAAVFGLARRSTTWNPDA